MTTVKQIFEATLIELSKIQAPPIKIYEFNYYINKVIQQYVNKVYNRYDINQQSTDDVRVLKSTARLTPTDIKHTIGGTEKYLGSEVYLPLDYLHLLNCVCVFKLLKDKQCWDKDDIIEIPAIRLTSDSWSNILTDIYNRPTPLRPYYYLHNINSENKTLPTNPYKDDTKLSTYELNQVGTDGTLDITKFKNTNNSSLLTDSSKTPSGDGSNDPNLKEKSANSRLSNSSNVRCELRYGNDNKVFQLMEVHIDYLKSPKFIRFTQKELDSVEDISQIMEFPDYVNQEITNELVQTIMAHVNDPRLGNTVQMNQSIAMPTQQQEQPKK